MKTRTRHLVAATLGAFTLAASLPAGTAGYGNMPLVFEHNAGQAASSIDYVARGMGYRLSLSEGEAYLALNADNGSLAVNLRLLDANPSPKVTSEEPLTTRVNYFVGNRPEAWRTDIPTFGKVRYRSVYPGIDLVYYGNQGQLEYDFVVAPGANPNRIRFQFDAADEVRPAAGGALEIIAKGASLHLGKPKIYQQVEGQRRVVAGSYRINEDGEISFAIGDYDRRHPLVIDPVLVYSTFLGGSSGGFDRLTAIAVDDTGHAYVTGFTPSSDFPTQNPFQGALAGTQDIVVAKLNPEGLGARSTPPTSAAQAEATAATTSPLTPPGTPTSPAAPTQPISPPPPELSSPPPPRGMKAASSSSAPTVQALSTPPISAATASTLATAFRSTPPVMSTCPVLPVRRTCPCRAPTLRAHSNSHATVRQRCLPGQDSTLPDRHSSISPTSAAPSSTVPRKSTSTPSATSSLPEQPSQLTFPPSAPTPPDPSSRAIAAHRMTPSSSSSMRMDLT